MLYESSRENGKINVKLLVRDSRYLDKKLGGKIKL